MTEVSLVQLAVLLAAAAIAAPMAKLFKIGAVLGYLLVGMLIGPYALSVFNQVDNILHIAEFGVVLLLFIIGLELKPQRLWAMRSAVFGVGTLQVTLTATLLLAILMLTGRSAREAAFIGLALALSSTAFVIQVLNEKGELGKPHGRLGFSVLLFQDLAAIPMIAFITLFSIGGNNGEPMSWSAAVIAGAAILLVVLAGHYLLPLLYRFAAKTGVKEAQTACALLTVVVVAILMKAAGLSAALGAFIAGALLADSEYRHEIEADIKPFEGLLLGLFFIAIGMSLNLKVIFDNPGYVLAATFTLLAAKSLVLMTLGRWYGLKKPAARRFALALSQGGEFAFVLATAGHASGVIFRPTADMLTVVVTLSMMATPLLLIFDDFLVARTKPEDTHYDDIEEKKEHHVVIAGFGRFGQITARILSARKIPFTALDISASQVDFVKRFGNKIYYGDSTRLDILQAAQIDKASALVIAIDDIEASINLTKLVQRTYPDIPIYARARNRRHYHMLMDAGAHSIERETFLASLELSRRVLRGIGMSETEARHTVTTFAEHDRSRLVEDYKHFSDDEKLFNNAKKYNHELEELFEQDSENNKTKNI